MSESKPKVVAFPAGKSGCAFWRIHNPLHMAQEKHGKDMDIVVLDTTNMSNADLTGEPMTADLVVFQSPGSEMALDLISHYKGAGKKIVIDYDDYSFDLSPYNPRYKDLGTKEVKAVGPDGKERWVWRDGFGGFDLKSNLKRYDDFVKCCRAADVITVTTDYLANKFKVHAPTAVLPNSLDMRRWVRYPKVSAFKDQVRIGWFGGDSHYKDLELIHEQVLEVIQKYPQARLVLLTPQMWPELFGKFPKDRVEYSPWADLSFYPFILSTMFWDIGLAPIEVNEFGKCKSNIKWMEYGAVGVPTVATNTIPYSDTIRHGADGMLADNENFFNAISGLVESEAARRDMADKAFKRVESEFNLEKNCSLWVNLYKSVIDSCEKSWVQRLLTLGKQSAST